MTREEALTKALDALHRIAMGAAAKRRFEMGDVPTNAVLRAGMGERAMGLCEIERVAINVWEEIVSEVEPKLPGTTMFACSPGDGEPR